MLRMFISSDRHRGQHTGHQSECRKNCYMTPEPANRSKHKFTYLLIASLHLPVESAATQQTSHTAPDTNQDLIGLEVLHPLF